MPPILLQTPPGGGNMAQWVILSVGILAVVYLIMRKPRRRDPLAGGSHLSLAQQRAVERDMSNLLVELSEMARQVSAQLDTRSAKLELLLKEADEKIRRLETAGSSASEPSEATGHPPAPPTDPRHAEIYQLADQGHSSRLIAQRLGRPNGEIELILALRAR